MLSKLRYLVVTHYMKSLDKSLDQSNAKPIEQYFHVVLFSLLYKVVPSSSLRKTVKRKPIEH